MSLIPENKPKKPDTEPKVFFFFGGTMSGKSYTANEFPDPLILNTDDNAKKFSTPSIDIKPVREMVKKQVKVNVKNPKTGKVDVKTKTVERYDIVKPTHKILQEVLGDLAEYQKTSDKPYRTLVIDVIDDIANSEEEYILQYFNEVVKSDKVSDYEYIGDIPHAGGWGRFNSFFRQIIQLIREFGNGIEYIIFVSRQKNGGTDEKPEFIPAIRASLVNEINGFGDFMIHFQKLGQNYSRSADYKRKAYSSEDITNPQIKDILMNTRYALVDSDGKGNLKTQKVKK